MTEGSGRDEIEVELTLQPLLNDLHVQHAEEAAAEAVAEGDGRFRLVGEGSVVELELFERVAQVGVTWSRPRCKCRSRPCCAPGGSRAAPRRQGRVPLGDGVADAGVRHVFDARGEVADVAGGELIAGVEPHRAQMPDLEHLILRARRHQADGRILADHAVHDADIAR